MLLLDRAEEARVAEEEELTPLEVLTELCWMASFWGLPGTDISSQLSSLSETALGKTEPKEHVRFIFGRFLLH